MKNYVKILLYGYPLLATVEKDYEEHVRNKALLSYGGNRTAEQLAEYLASEILEMRRLEWLKGKIQEVIEGLDEKERFLLSIRYFGKTRRIKALLQRKGEEGGIASWKARTYFRRQQRLGEALCSRFLAVGITEEVYLRDYADMPLFAKIRKCVEEGRDKKISANERRWIAVGEE